MKNIDWINIIGWLNYTIHGTTENQRCVFLEDLVYFASGRQRKQQYFVKLACIPIRRPMTLFVPIPETGDPYIFLD